VVIDGGYIKDEPGYDYLSNKIYFYKNKPVVGTYTTIMDITYITYLTDDLPDYQLHHIVSG
jgi:hypothetical protein